MTITAAEPSKKSFAAFQNRDFTIFLTCATAAMMADNIEHVITYWVIFQKFKSPALGGFAVISHWVPYLAFGALTGALADRFDIRRLIQTGMFMFAGVSICWGIMFMAGRVNLWFAMVLLVVHGLAGVIWVPAAQVFIHDLVPVRDITSAVRLNATSRYLAFLAGPAVGSGLFLLCGPASGIFINALIYMPLALWLIKAPYGPKFRIGALPPRAARGFADVAATLRVVARNPALLTMTLLAGAISFFVGNAYQAQMPGFAMDLGHGRQDFSYSALLAADAFGGLVAGVVLESFGLLQPKRRTAILLAIVWCASLIAFALTRSYWAALLVLPIAGFVELGCNSMAQALVQLNAPSEIRGRVIGVFSMSALGMRTFSGVSVGLLGAAVGIHRSLALSAGVLLCVCLGLLWFEGRTARVRAGDGNHS